MQKETKQINKCGALSANSGNFLLVLLISSGKLLSKLTKKLASILLLKARVMTMALASSGQEGTITTNLHSVVDVQSHDNGLGLQRLGRDNNH